MPVIFIDKKIVKTIKKLKTKELVIAYEYGIRLSMLFTKIIKKINNKNGKNLNVFNFVFFI